MRKLFIKYLIEFLVIVIGISLSFYVDSYNEKKYKENLKNQSLRRILNNIDVDTKDFEFNLNANRKAIYSTDWISKRNHNLKLYSRDSIGFHLNRAIYFNFMLSSSSWSLSIGDGLSIITSLPLLFFGKAI